MLGLELLKQNTIDLVLLDVILPGINGREVAIKIRELGYNNVPILMLTALSSTENVVQGLDSGADDYLAKPFKFKELLARIRALTRRSRSGFKLQQKIQLADLVLDNETKTVTRSDQEIKLTSTEFRLLEFLLKNEGKVTLKV